MNFGRHGKPFQDASTLDETWRYIFTDTQMEVSGAMQSLRSECQSHTVWSAETGLKVRSCPKSPTKFADATKNRSNDVKQRQYRWNQDLDGSMSYHQVKWLAKRQESNRQAKSSKRDVSDLVNELMHLGAAISPRLRDGLENWQQ